MPSPDRVALRFAREFGSDKALKEYLRDHPGADPSKHSVTDHAEEGHGKEAPKEKTSWKDRFKGLSDKAAKFIKQAPKEVKAFIEDDAVRRKVAQQAHETLTKAPEKLGRRLLEAAKHEVKEFKEAGEGVATLMKGGKMNSHQKKALRTVSIHLAIGIAAAALTTTGPLAAAGAFGKGVARKIALKSVTKALENVHMFQEIGHITHGLHALHAVTAADKGKELSPEEALVAVLTAAVAEQISHLDDSLLREVLEETAGEDA